MSKLRQFFTQHGKTVVYPVLGIVIGWMAGTKIDVTDEPCECAEVAPEGTGNE